MTNKLSSLVAALVAVLALAGCGGDGEEAQGDSYTAANGDRFNDADVAFATDMIQHHAQALQMVDMAGARELSPEVAQLTEDIRAAQVPEIEQLTAWLTSWDRPVPETVRDHANAHGDGDAHAGTDMPGMMSEQDLADLEAAKGQAFEGRWLQLMIEHHQGAIEMAQAHQDSGLFRPALRMAGSIEKSQLAEIDHMRTLLAP